MPAVTSKTTDNILNAERVSFVVDYKKARPSVIRRTEDGFLRVLHRSRLFFRKKVNN